MASQSVAIDLASETPAIIEFGHFRIVPHRRELPADGQPIPLSGRTFDVLMALIDQCGAKVGHRSANAGSSTQAAAMPPAIWATARKHFRGVGANPWTPLAWAPDAPLVRRALTTGHPWATLGSS